MKFHRTPIEVDAVKMTCDFALDGQKGKPGDYLVTFGNGDQYIYSPDSFNEMFAEGAFEAEPQPSSIPCEFTRRTVAAAPSRPEDFDRDEQQTSVAACFTCGEDVRVSQMDALKNCPACASKYILKPAAESLPVVAPEQSNGPRIVLCPACGGPGPAERMNADGCFRCDPGLMAEAMASVGG
jgi:DNA-directed RNA polymerase subunit RPC12/RpoP